MSNNKKQSLDEAVFAALKTRSENSGAYGTFEVSRSDEDVMSAVNYVLLMDNDPFDSIVGGFPFGRISEVYGLESCGKTAFAIRAAGKAKTGRIYRIENYADKDPVYTLLDEDDYEITVLYIDNEQSLDDDSKLVVDGARMKFLTARAETIEATFKIIDDMISVVEKRSELEKAKKGKQRLQFAVIIVDTIASSASKSELSAQWGVRDFPRLPGEISRGFSKLVRRINVNNVSLICTNQVRTAMNGAMIKGDESHSYTSPGGLALRFYASHRVFMMADMGNYRLRPERRFPDGLRVTFKTVKNRIRKPQRKGKMVLLFDKDNGGFNNLMSMLETMVYMKTVDVSAKDKGTGYTLKLKKHGVSPVGELVQPTLEEQDDAPAAGPKPGRFKEPTFTTRADWPLFYANNKAVCDALWQCTLKRMFESTNFDAPADAEDEESVNDEED